MCCTMCCNLWMDAGGGSGDMGNCQRRSDGDSLRG